MINKCVFLAAGYGTRFLPVTKSIPKEMLPILEKPLIQYGVEEAVEAGLTEIAVVTGRGKRAIEDHFDDNIELESHLKRANKFHYLEELLSLTNQCSFSYTRQRQMLGTGHAVLTSRVLVGDAPFAVVLCDDLCFNPDQGVLSQLVDVYLKHKCCIVAVEEVPTERIDRYGIIDAQLQDDQSYLVNSLIEKPKPADAPSNLGVVGRYILEPQIFDEIERTAPGVGGEIQLTDALNSLAHRSKVVACRFKGLRFDCGSINGFVDATNYCLKARSY